MDRSIDFPSRQTLYTAARSRHLPIRVPLRIYNSSFPRVHPFIESIVSPTHAKIPFELAQRDERHSPCPSPRLDSNLLTSKRREGDYNLVPLSLGGMTQHDSFFCKSAVAQSSPLMVSAPRLSTYGRDHVIPFPIHAGVLGILGEHVEFHVGMHGTAFSAAPSMLSEADPLRFQPCINSSSIDIRLSPHTIELSDSNNLSRMACIASQR